MSITLLSIPAINVIIGVAVLVIAFQIAMVVRVLILKRRTEKEMKIELDASNRIQKMVDDIHANPNTYTDDQKSKCIQVLMSSISSTKKEEHFKKILQIA